MKLHSLLTNLSVAPPIAVNDNSGPLLVSRPREDVDQETKVVLETWVEYEPASRRQRARIIGIVDTRDLCDVGADNKRFVITREDR